MAPDRSPAFQFYPKDFITDERVWRMSLQQRGAYITLLCACWLEQSLPSEIDALAKIVGVPETAFRKFWPGIQPCFTMRDDGRMVQKRLEMEREKQADYRRRMTDRATRAASKRWAS